MLYPLFGLKSFAYQFLGTLLQALWIPALWILLRARGFGSSRVLMVVVCTAASTAIFVNTVYVWPKMLAGALALTALAVVVTDGSLVLAAVLAALALLAHGRIAFSLFAFVPLLWRVRPRRGQVGRALAAGACVYLPWIAYQRFMDPPGDRLLKWQLAGLSEPDRHSFLHDLIRQYFHDPVHAFLIDKLLNLEHLAYNPAAVTPTTWSRWPDFLATARGEQVTALLMAVGPLLLGVLGLASANVRRSLQAVRPLLLFVLVSMVVWVILEYGAFPAGTVIHQGPYTLLVLAVALAALTTTYLPTWAAALIISTNLVWFAAAFFPGFGYAAEQPGVSWTMDRTMVGLGLACLALVSWMLWRSDSTGEDEPHRNGSFVIPARPMSPPATQSVHPQ